jgi:NADPH:quinone reductase-like Zn-dependent oxidoreductase
MFFTSAPPAIPRTTRCASLNAHDLWSIRGIGVRPDQFPMVLGCDATGCDPDGNEVIIHPVFGDPDEGDGDETLDPRRALMSEQLDGAFAEYVLAPARSVLPKPRACLFTKQPACLSPG